MLILQMLIAMVTFGQNANMVSQVICMETMWKTFQIAAQSVLPLSTAMHLTVSLLTELQLFISQPKADREKSLVFSGLSVHCLMWRMIKCRAFRVSSLSRLVFEAEVRESTEGMSSGGRCFFPVLTGSLQLTQRKHEMSLLETGLNRERMEIME